MSEYDDRGFNNSENEDLSNYLPKILRDDFVNYRNNSRRSKQHLNGNNFPPGFLKAEAKADKDRRQAWFEREHRRFNNPVLQQTLSQIKPGGNQLVFIDSALEDPEVIIDNLSGSPEIIFLDQTGEDEVFVIGECLRAYQQVDAVHIFSHGQPGQISFANAELNQQTLPQYKESIQGWGDFLSQDADLIFYGCDVASGEEGDSLIKDISQITGADILASVDQTGKNGDWDLETAVGEIEATSSIVNPEMDAAYQNNLYPTVELDIGTGFNDGFSDGFSGGGFNDGFDDFFDSNLGDRPIGDDYEDDDDNEERENATQFENFTGVAASDLRSLVEENDVDFNNYSPAQLATIDFNNIPPGDFEVLKGAGLKIEGLDPGFLAGFNLYALSNFGYLEGINLAATPFNEFTTLTDLSNVFMAHANLYSYKPQLALESGLDLAKLPQLSQSDYEAINYAFAGDESFDANYYLSTYADVAQDGVNPFYHYMTRGVLDNPQRNPNATLSTSYYLSRHTDVADEGVNPLKHHNEFGASEGRHTTQESEERDIASDVIAGALQGDFNEDPNFWSAVGQIATGVIPIAGQIADGRDFLKALSDLEQSEYKSLGAWAALGLVTVGFVPGVGDAISKVGRKGFEVLSNSGIVKRLGRLLDAEVVQNLVTQAGDLATPIVNGIKDAIVTKLNEIQDAARQLGDEVAQGVDNVIEEVTGQRTFDRMAIETGPGGGQLDNTNQPQPKQPSPSPDSSVPIGRVAEPGGQPDKLRAFKDNTQVPEKYRNDPRFEELATDPDKGNKVIPDSRAEAMAGLEAESQGLVPGPIKRGPEGTEFYDAQGRPWDVKAPPSPSTGAKWKFNPEAPGKSIQKELGEKATPKGAAPGTYPNELTGQPEPRRVILDSSYMTKADHSALWKWLNDNLTADELNRIVEINTQLQ